MIKILKIPLQLLIVALIFAIFAEVFHYYQLLTNEAICKNDTSNYLASINAVVQIGYNIVYLIIAIAVVIIAISQLKKTREATTIQTLINIDNYIRSDIFLEKRKKLADLILVSEIANFPIWFEKIDKKDLKKLSTGDIEKLAIVKNIFESVIYQFELIGHFYKKHIFEIEDVYQLFSVEIQNYWVLMLKTGYIDYLRKNKANPNIDFYDNFEKLFNDIIKQEIINHSSSLTFKLILRLFYWTNFYKVFYKGQSYRFYPKKKKNKIHIRIEEFKAGIDLFLVEEKSLI